MNFMYEVHLYVALEDGADEDLGMVYWNTSKRLAWKLARRLNWSLMSGSKARYGVEIRRLLDDQEASEGGLFCDRSVVDCRLHG